jgi:radical SAM superfamily enzyme with C-terminal helix-hairpin-helix motif
MKRTVVRYKAKPEKAEENARLIEKVFEELRMKSPAGVRYLALRLGDGTFVHFSTADTADGTSPIPALEAFRAFQSGIKERCVEPPQSSDVTIVGNYRMLGE